MLLAAFLTLVFERKRGIIAVHSSDTKEEARYIFYDADNDQRSSAELLCKYNKEPFHLLHALTVEGVMRWFAQDQGYGAEADFLGHGGLLHDIDF